MESSSLEQLLLLVECPICFETLDGDNRMLPCQHTFCRGCLEQVSKTSNELRCPECRAVHNVSVNVLQRNILVIRILEFIEQSEKKAPKSKSDDRADSLLMNKKPMLKFSSSAPQKPAVFKFQGTGKRNTKEQKSLFYSKLIEFQNYRENSKIINMPKNRTSFDSRTGLTLGYTPIQAVSVTNTQACQENRPFGETIVSSRQVPVLESTYKENIRNHDNGSKDSSISVCQLAVREYLQRYCEERSIHQSAILSPSTVSVSPSEKNQKFSHVEARSDPLNVVSKLSSSSNSNATGLVMKNSSINSRTAFVFGQTPVVPVVATGVYQKNCPPGDKNGQVLESTLRENRNHVGSSKESSILVHQSAVQLPEAVSVPPYVKALSKLASLSNSTRSNSTISNSVRSALKKEELPAGLNAFSKLSFSFNSDAPTSVLKNSVTDSANILSSKSKTVTPSISQQISSCKNIDDILAANGEASCATEALDKSISFLSYWLPPRAKIVALSNPENEKLKVEKNASASSKPLRLSGSDMIVNIWTSRNEAQLSNSNDVKNVVKGEKVFKFQATDSTMEKSSRTSELKFINENNKNHLVDCKVRLGGASNGQNNTRDLRTVVQPSILPSSAQNATHSSDENKNSTFSVNSYSFNIGHK